MAAWRKTYTDVLWSTLDGERRKMQTAAQMPRKGQSLEMFMIRTILCMGAALYQGSHMVLFQKQNIFLLNLLCLDDHIYETNQPPKVILC